MHLFWIGLIFLLLQGNVTIAGTAVHLLPDTLGFLLLFIGMMRMKKQSRRFAAGSVAALVFGILALGQAVLTYAVPDFSDTLLFGDSILTLISDIILLGKLLTLYLLILGLGELAQTRNADLKQKPLHMLWIILACANIPILALSVVTANLYNPPDTLVKIAYFVYTVMAILIFLISAAMIVF